MTPPPQWTQDLQEQFAADLCHLLIVCNVAWWAVDHPFLREFFKRWVPGAVVPHRQTLSGRILIAEAEKIVARIKNAVRHRFATGQCDGWKNIARTSLVASVINVEYVVGHSIIAE